MSGDNEKSSLPSYYVLPEVWELPASSGGTFGAINQPTAGARFEADLPKGKHPLQLYSLGTPNGQKVTILLEELGIEYDAWRIDIFEQEQFSSGFVEINPNSKIPALMDYSNDEPIRIFESGAIMIYLAEKENKFIPTSPKERAECLSWLMWQMGTAPFIGGGFGHFYRYAPMYIEYAINRYTMELKRILDVLDKQLADNQYVTGNDYNIADMAIFPWIKAIPDGYKATKFVQFDQYEHVNRWKNEILERDAVIRGIKVNGFGDEALRERHSADDFKTLEKTPAEQR